MCLGNRDGPNSARFAWRIFDQVTNHCFPTPPELKTSMRNVLIFACCFLSLCSTSASLTAGDSYLIGGKIIDIVNTEGSSSVDVSIFYSRQCGDRFERLESTLDGENRSVKVRVILRRQISRCIDLIAKPIGEHRISVSKEFKLEIIAEKEMSQF